MNVRQWLLSAGISAACAALMAGLSQWPVTLSPDDAVVRLSWRTEPVHLEACRRPTAEELAAVPAHMRRAEICDRRFASYELTLAIDDRPAMVDTVAPSGVRGDRPVYVLRSEPVSPGEHRVDVAFRALLPDGDAARESGETPNVDALRWSGEMHLGPRQIGLVTLDAAGSTLVLR